LYLLAISRTDGTFPGAPDGDTMIRDGDTLIIYGRAEVLSKLEKRLKGIKGNEGHLDMTRKQKKVKEQEKKKILKVSLWKNYPLETWVPQMM
jgi:uncharacterized protein with PhoU and TrkA domain